MSINDLKIGDKVWFAYHEIINVEIPCPCCFGKLKVRVILGNDEEIEVPCGCRSVGYEGLKGYIKEYQWVAKPVLVTIFTIKREESLNGCIIEYYFDYDKRRFYTTDKDNNIFFTEEEAKLRCLECVKTHELEEKQKLERHKERTNKSYAWHVFYHQREAKRCKKQLEYHEQRAINCKLRAKTEIK